MLIKEDQWLMVREVVVQFRVGHHNDCDFGILESLFPLSSLLTAHGHKMMCMDMLLQLFDDMLLIVMTSGSTS